MDSNAEKLNAALNDRARQLNEILIARTREINESLTGGERTISTTLDDVLSKLNSALDEKGSSFRQSLQSSVDDTIMDLDLRSGFFDERLQATVAQLSTSFDERVAEFTNAFDKRAGSLDTKLIGEPQPHQRYDDGQFGLIERHPEFEHRAPWRVAHRPVLRTGHCPCHQPGSAWKARWRARFPKSPRPSHTHTTGMTSALSHATSEISLALASGTSELHNNLAARADGIPRYVAVHDLRPQLCRLRGTEQITSAFGRADELNTMISRRAADITQALELRARADRRSDGRSRRCAECCPRRHPGPFQSTLASRSDAIINAVSGSHERLADTLDDKAMTLAISLDESQNRFEDTIAKRAEAIAASIASGHEKLADTLDDQGNGTRHFPQRRAVPPGRYAWPSCRCRRKPAGRQPRKA